MYGGRENKNKIKNKKVRLHWLVLDRRKAVVGNRVGNDTKQKELRVVIVTVYDTNDEKKRTTRTRVTYCRYGSRERSSRPSQY